MDDAFLRSFLSHGKPVPDIYMEKKEQMPTDMPNARRTQLNSEIISLLVQKKKGNEIKKKTNRGKFKNIPEKSVRRKGEPVY
jgi:hypothetical protein